MYNSLAAVHWCRSAVTRRGFENPKLDSIWVGVTCWGSFWELGQTKQTDSVMSVLIELFFNKQKDTIRVFCTGKKGSVSGDHQFGLVLAATWRRQWGQFRPSYQLCTVPKSASVHADTCSLTHTAVARIRVCTQHSAVSCRSGESARIGSGGA